MYMHNELVLESATVHTRTLEKDKGRIFKERKEWKEQVMMKRKRQTAGRRGKLLLGYTVGWASRRVGKEQPHRWPSPTHMQPCMYLLSSSYFTSLLSLLELKVEVVSWLLFIMQSGVQLIVFTLVQSVGSFDPKWPSSGEECGPRAFLPQTFSLSLDKTRVKCRGGDPVEMEFRPWPVSGEESVIWSL